MRYLTKIGFFLFYIFIISCWPDQQTGSDPSSFSVIKIETSQQKYLGNPNSWIGSEKSADQLKDFLEMQLMMQEADSAILNGVLFFIVEGDYFLLEEEFYRYFQMKKVEELYPDQFLFPKLIILTDDGEDMVQDNPENIVFGIVEDSFSDQEYLTIKKLIQKATSDWESTCRVKFIYKEEMDHQLEEYYTPDDFTFIIQKEADLDIIAKAPFPGQDKTLQQLLIDDSFFSITSFSKEGILRHELGHILGFLHEHLSEDASDDCPKVERTDSRPLTVMDSLSVMHYLCNNKGGTRALEISYQDSIGSNCVYPTAIFTNDSCEINLLK